MSSLVRCTTEAIIKHEEYKTMNLIQKEIKDSLQANDKKEEILRKRSYNEANNIKNFGTGSGRNLENLVFSTTYLQTY